MCPTMYHLWFLEYQRVLPQLRLHLPLHHLPHRIQYLMLTETQKIQYKKEVEVRVKSFGETRCIIPQKPKTKMKTRDLRKYKEIFRITCLIGYRNSGRIWSMTVLQQSIGETPYRKVQTLQVRLMILQWSREHTWKPGSGKHSAFTHFPKDPKCEICLKTENNKGFLQKTR